MSRSDEAKIDHNHKTELLHRLTHSNNNVSLLERIHRFMNKKQEKKNLRTLGISALIIVGSLAVVSPILAQNEGVKKVRDCGFNFKCYTSEYVVKDSFGNVININELYRSDEKLVARNIGVFYTFEQYSSIAEKIGGTKISDTGTKRVYRLPSGGTITVENVKANPEQSKSFMISQGYSIDNETDTKIVFRDQNGQLTALPKSDTGSWSHDGGLYKVEFQSFLKTLYGDNLYTLIIDTDPDGKRMYLYEGAKEALAKLESTKYDSLKTDEERGEYFKTMSHAVSYLHNNVIIEDTNSESKVTWIYPYKGKNYHFTKTDAKNTDSTNNETTPMRVFDEKGNFLAEYVE